MKNGLRDDLQTHLKPQRIGTSIYYPRPLHLQECFRELGYEEGDLPVSEKGAAEVLSLPVFPKHTEEEQTHIVQVIFEFFKQAGISP